MIVLTGGAGFIGSVYLWKLNSRGVRDVLVVDEKDISDRGNNLAGKKYTDVMDKDAFIERIRIGHPPKGVTAVVHIGACASTTVTDEAYVRKNNFEYTRDLALWAVKNGIRFLYASSAATYGDGSLGSSDTHERIPDLRPLNLYGRSKQDFDLFALQKGLLDKIAGFKFFNVYGPNEYHKGDMKSVIAKSYEMIAREKAIRLFKSHRKEYGHGEQKRDFIYVKDAVEAVDYFLLHPEKNGLYNVGTGRARTWNDLARALFAAMNLPVKIEYIDMPENIRGQYQYFTEADTGKLRAAGYDRPFVSLEEGVRDYCHYLKERVYL